MLHRAISRLIGIVLTVSFLLPVMGVSADLGGPTPTLVKDINPTISSGSDPQAFMQAGDVTFIFIKNEEGRNELRKTDGTGPGTTLVKQGVGPAGFKDYHKWFSPFGWYAFYNGVVFFAGKDDAGSTELWRTDGSEAGTFKVLTSTSLLISDPTNMIIYNDNLYLIGGGNVLYKIYNTSNGALYLQSLSPVKSNVVAFNGSLFYITQDFNTNKSYLNKVDLAWDSVYSVTAGLEPNPNSRIMVFNGALYFSARETGDADPLHGWELWRMDTSQQFSLVKDIHPTGNASPAILGETNGWLIFSAQDGTNGRGIWRTDGTLSGSTLVKDFSADQGTGLSIQLLEVVGGKLAISVTGDISDSGLWTTNGSTSGTIRIGDIPEWDYFVWAVFNDHFYYSATSAFHGTEVWATDGISSGAEYADFYPGARSSLPLAMAACGSRLCISADDGQHGTELWATDGTQAGTQMVVDMNTAPPDSSPWGFTKAEGQAFFIASDQVSATNLWRTDSTQAGTVALNQDSTISFVGLTDLYQQGLLLAIGSNVYFTASDPAHGQELWRSDGTMAGTKMVKDIYPGVTGSMPYQITVVEDRIYFVANNPEIGRELWVSDGNEDGTQLVKDIYPNNNSSYYIRSLVAMGERIVFTIYDYDDQLFQLWVSDGSELGTMMIASFVKAQYLVEAGDMVFFVGRETNVSSEYIYMTDGTVIGTKPVSNDTFNYVTGLYSAGERIFIIDNEGYYYFIYSFDVNSNGIGSIHLVQDKYIFGRSSTPGCIVFEGNLGCTFQATDGYTFPIGEVYLWVSDGTYSGTRQITGNFSWPAQLMSNGPTLTFSADTPGQGRQLWETDGTLEGTEQISHFNEMMCSPTLHSPTAAGLAYLNGHYLLPLEDTGSNPAHGCELWALDMRVPQAFLPVIRR